jgi:SAM-dependent methyltransferase
LPFEKGAFDAIFLQHVAMNIEDRSGLYAEVRRTLAAGGRFATYDVMRRSGEVIYPVPWARDESSSFLLTEDAARTALEKSGFEAELWRDDTQAALDWFKTAVGAPPRGGLNLGVVMGADFPTIAGNLARNIRENRLGVLSAVLIARG